MFDHFTWSRHGGYEVSTAGDTRFSAFNAILHDGRSIEVHYQCDIKGYDVGGVNWRMGKGQPPLFNKSEEELWKEYYNLWLIWAKDNVILMEELREMAGKHNNVLSDMFANTPMNQARALATLLNNNKYRSKYEF